MKKIDLKTLIITCIFCLLPIVLGVTYYDILPDKVAIHFDIHNNPDNYLPKALFVFGMPIFMILIQIFCSVIVDIGDKNKEANRKVSIVCKWIIPVITITMYVVTMLFNLNYIVDIRAYVMLLLGVMFMVIGNYMPKTVGATYNKHKYKDEGVQKRMNKMAGYLFIAFGALLIISVFLETIISAIVIVFFIIAMIVLMIYGYYEDKKAVKIK